MNISQIIDKVKQLESPGPVGQLASLVRAVAMHVLILAEDVKSSRADALYVALCREHESFLARAEAVKEKADHMKMTARECAGLWLRISSRAGALVAYDADKVSPTHWPEARALIMAAQVPGGQTP